MAGEKTSDRLEKSRDGGRQNFGPFRCVSCFVGKTPRRNMRWDSTVARYGAGENKLCFTENFVWLTSDDISRDCLSLHHSVVVRLSRY
jgi:hypothetical protein